MKRLVFLFLSFVLSSAERHDLSGKMFTFPMVSDTARVKVKPVLNSSMTAVTVCLRFFSDVSRAQSLFSMATPGTDNAFLMFKTGLGNYEINALGSPDIDFWGLEDKQNRWHSACGTWDTVTGLAQFWVNGKPSARKGVGHNGNAIVGTCSIILGQDQDSYGGRFDKDQSFVGMLTDVHMWDSVLSASEIFRYNKRDFSPGNVINWHSLEFQKYGYVLIENIQQNVEEYEEKL